jgi:hypothetical protein
MNTDLVVASPEIKGGEHCGTMEHVHDLIDTWEGVAVLDSGIVESTVVDAEA